MVVFRQVLHGGVSLVSGGELKHLAVCFLLCAVCCVLCAVELCGELKHLAVGRKARKTSPPVSATLPQATHD